MAKILFLLNFSEKLEIIWDLLKIILISLLAVLILILQLYF